jgi:hypothetical protein
MERWQPSCMEWPGGFLMFFRLFPAGLLLSAIAAASPLTLTFTGTASGSVGNTVFTNEAFTITFTTDTASVVHGTPCCASDFTTPSGTPNTIAIEGIGSGSLTGDQAVFVNQSEQDVGIWHYNDPDWLTIGNPSIASYTLAGAIGPITGTTFVFPQVAAMPSTLGDVKFTVVSNVSFTAAAGQSIVSTATHFVPVTPCRIADTRNATGPFGGPAITGGTTRDFIVPNSACGIPPTAAAYSINVAVVPHGSLGFVTLWPAGQMQPVVATLTSVDGRIKSNAAIVPAGSSGAISVFATDTTDVVLDINGYFVPGVNATALAFYPLTPCRVADTRNANSPLGGPSLGAQSTRTFPILASSCGIPASAQAYSLNFAAVPKGPLGFLTAWPAGQTQPLVSSLNALTGTITANAVVVPAGTNGDVSVFTTSATDLVIDVNGYFAPQGPGGLSLFTMTPCRVLDTRLPTGTLPFAVTRDVNVTASACSVPNTARAFVFNATAVPPGPLGFITMFPQGQSAPLAATLNAMDGAITSNMAIVPTTTGSVSVFPFSPTQLVLDIFGFFAP